jgi:AraC-like DNA-binding protein
MADAFTRIHKQFLAQNELISVEFLTDRGSYHAAQFSKRLEMIYLLSGNAGLILDGTEMKLIQGEFIVVDARRICEFQCKESFMQIRISVDRSFLAEKLRANAGAKPSARMYVCSREDLTREQLPVFLKMCDLFKELVPLYINEPEGYRLRTESIVLELLYLLAGHFSIPLVKEDLPEGEAEPLRIQEILAYIEAHYAEPLTLETVSAEFGLSREYFSRLFHKSVGITFLQHLNRVRIAHLYDDLVHTDEGIMNLCERHGLTNYKLFSRLFKEIYGCTPREIRRRI